MQKSHTQYIKIYPLRFFQYLLSLSILSHDLRFKLIIQAAQENINYFPYKM